MIKQIVTFSIAFLFVFSVFGQDEKIEGRSHGFVPNGYVKMWEEDQKKAKLFPEDFRMSHPLIGSEFPSFAFEDIIRDSVSSEMLEGKIVLLNFTFVE